MLLGSLHDLQHDLEPDPGPGGELARRAGVGPDTPDRAERATPAPKLRLRAVAVLHTRHGDRDCQQQPDRVHRDVPLAAGCLARCPPHATGGRTLLPLTERR
jgi:hypothetical protein